MSTREKPVYLDHNATTPLDPRVRAIMKRSLEQFCGNPSSTHHAGINSRKTLETCRQECANRLQCDVTELYFTSGATEANNIVLQGFIRQALSQGRRPRILTAPIEHVSVLNPLRHYRKVIDLVECPVTKHPHGYIDHETFEQLIIQHRIELVSVAAINHEIGTIQDIRTLAQIAHRHGALLHSDYTQAIGKFPVFPEIDAVSFSAHKFYGPQGVGGLMLRTHVRPHFHQLMFGGDQENQLRPGTENVLGVVGMTAALEIAWRRTARDQKHVKQLAHQLFRHLDHLNIKYELHSASYWAINLSFPMSRLTSDALLQTLSTRQIYVSKGAACKSRTKQASYVLAAAGIHPRGPNIRIGIGRFNRPADITYLTHTLKTVL